MKRYYTLSAISLVLLILDQASKLYVDANFRLHETVPVIRGFFHLTYVRNKGAAFGILSDNAIRIPFFITVSIIAMLGILWYIKHLREDQKLAFFALSLVFSGAFGNLIDRIRLGEVIDFLAISSVFALELAPPLPFHLYSTDVQIFKELVGLSKGADLVTFDVNFHHGFLEVDAVPEVVTVTVSTTSEVQISPV